MKRIDAEKYATETAPDVGFSGFTPSSDGKFLYTWFGDGVTACYDLEGNRRWIRVDHRAAVEHGFSSSPLLIDGKFVVFMRDLMAFDAKTGKLAWKAPLVEADGTEPGGLLPWLAGGRNHRRDSRHRRWATARSCGPATAKCSSPTAKWAIRRLPPRSWNRGGFSRCPPGTRSWSCERCPRSSPIRSQLPTRRIALDLSGFPKHYLPWHLSSPVIDQGLAYLMNNAGVFTVVDVDAGKAVYQKLLDLDPLQAHNEGAARGVGVSLALAGGIPLLLRQQRRGPGPRAGPRLPADRQEQDRERGHGRPLGRAPGTVRGQPGLRRETGSTCAAKANLYAIGPAP